jgi:hypothetical protein
MNANSQTKKPKLSPESLKMKKLAVIYHSAHGHTEHIAQHVAEGAGACPIPKFISSRLRN